MKVTIINREDTTNRQVVENVKHISRQRTTETNYAILLFYAFELVGIDNGLHEKIVDLSIYRLLID